MSEYQLWVVFNYECWKCHKKLKVALNVSRTLDDYFSNDEIGSNDRMFSDEPIDPDIRKVLELHGCHLDMMYSKTVGDSYMANFCPYCNSIQGEYFLKDLYMELIYTGPLEYLLFKDRELIMSTNADSLEDMAKKLNEYRDSIESSINKQLREVIKHSGKGSIKTGERYHVYVKDSNMPGIRCCYLLPEYEREEVQLMDSRNRMITILKYDVIEKIIVCKSDAFITNEYGTVIFSRASEENADKSTKSD